MKIAVNFLITALAVILVCMPKQVSAIDISENPDKQNALNLSGEIKPKDAEKLAGYFKNSNLPKMLFIDSPGGDLIEALRMADIIRLLHLQVAIPKGRNCLSACFLLYLAGSGRTAAGTTEGIRDSRMPVGFVGLHRPYIRSIDSTEQSQSAQSNAMKKVSKYLEDQLVPRRLIDMMMSRPSNDIYWLTDEDINELGDYTPAQEELYISKCDYDRRLLYQIYVAQKSGNDTLYSMLDQRMHKTYQCIAEMQNKAYVQGLTKLLQGWLPQKNPLQNM